MKTYSVPASIDVWIDVNANNEDEARNIVKYDIEFDLIYKNEANKKYKIEFDSVAVDVGSAEEITEGSA